MAARQRGSHLPGPCPEYLGDGADNLRRPEYSDAVLLFSQRARAIQPEYAITNANVEYVDKICRHLDGIALAIELAAARLRVMSEQESPRNWGNVSPYSHPEAGMSCPRCALYRASLDWSYELLDPLEQEVLDRLSVFHGGCALPEAQHVCGKEGLA